MIRRRISRLFLAATTLAAPACLSPEALDPDLESVESGVRVRPQGTQSSGKLKVVLPASVPPSTFGYSANGLSKVELFAEQEGRSTPIPLGSEVALAPGPMCLRLRVGEIRKSFGTWMERYAEGATDCSLTITSGQTTIYTLGVVSFSLSEEVFGIGDIFRPVDGWNLATVDVPKCARALDAAGDESAIVHCAYEAHRMRPVLAGRYTYTWGVADGISVTIAQGDVRSINLADASARRVVRVTAPTRELPEASGETWYEVQGDGKTVKKQPVPGTTYQLGVAPGSGVAHTLAIVSAANRQERALTIPAVAGAADTFAVGRLDVDHVQMSDGETAAGRWTLERQDGASFVAVVAPPQSFATNTGIDVLPGTYRLTTTYTRLDGTAGTDTLVVPVP